MTTTTNLLDVLPDAGRDRLMKLAREVSFPAGAHIFHEGHRADRFWIIRTGAVTLDMHVPGRRSPAIETLYPGDLLGWSWLFPPYVWHLGAEALRPVLALEFDAEAVRGMCRDDPALGQALTYGVAQVIGHRLQTARARLVELYGAYGEDLAP